MTTTQAAELLGRSSELSNIEAGRFGVSADRCASAHPYPCIDQGLRSAGRHDRRPQARMVGGIPGNPSAQLLDLAEIEHHGTGLHAAVSVHIPGLFQTAEYAREIYRQAVPELSPPDIEHRISYRIKRQAVLYRAAPSPHGQSSTRLRCACSSAADMTRGTLQHLRPVSEQDRMTIRVIPF